MKTSSSSDLRRTELGADAEPLGASRTGSIAPPPAPPADAPLRPADGVDGTFSKAMFDKYVDLGDRLNRQTDRLGVDPLSLGGLVDHFEMEALKNDAGFRSLDAETQAKMLAAAQASPRPLAKNFIDLANDFTFRALPPAVQAVAAEQIGKHPSDTTAYQTFYRLLHTTGFEKLRPEEQVRMLRYVGGTNDYVSDPARRALATLIGSAEYRAAQPSHKERLMREFLEKQTASVGNTNEVAVTAKRETSSYTPAKDIGEYAFTSGKTDAVTHEVTVGDVTVKVTMPKNAGAHIHTIDEVTAALAALPRASLLAIKEVVVEPNHNPEDPNWAVTYGDPDFQSYMTAGAAGVVSIYPVEDKAQSRILTAVSGTETHAWFKPPQWSMDQSIIHETGHILSQKNWGGNTNDPRWDGWKNAAKSDGIYPSQYAQKSPQEDFAEALVIYMNVKGTKEEAEVRAIMPERFRMLDELLAKR